MRLDWIPMCAAISLLVLAGCKNADNELDNKCATNDGDEKLNEQCAALCEKNDPKNLYACERFERDAVMQCFERPSGQAWQRVAGSDIGKCTAMCDRIKKTEGGKKLRLVNICGDEPAKK